MRYLDKDAIKTNKIKKMKSYASVCNSCACGGGVGSCNTTCKGCKDKNHNVDSVRKIYSR